MKFFEATFKSENISFLQLHATYILLDLKDDSLCKFIYLYNYFIVFYIYIYIYVCVCVCVFVCVCVCVYLIDTCP